MRSEARHESFRSQGGMERWGRPSRDWAPQERERHDPEFRDHEGRERQGRGRDAGERPERGRDARPDMRAEPRTEPRPETRMPRGDARPERGRSAAAYPTQVRAREDVRAWQSQRGWQREGAWRPHDSWREHRADNWQAVHRTWQQRGGYGGYYIPQERFYATFGPTNYFRFRPEIYMGYPRFWFANYSFMIVDPWPAYWDDDWYDYGDCYIDFVDGGYYLYNRRYPGVALAVTVML